MRGLLAASVLGAALGVGLFAAPAGATPAAPTVSPNPVAAGKSIQVHGSNCTSLDNFTVGVDVAILDSGSKVIAAGGVSHDQLVGGSWTATLIVPAGTPAGQYRVDSTCDQYQASFSYPPVALAVTSGATPIATISLSPTTVAIGGQLTVGGSGFAPNEAVTVLLHSTTVTLTTLTASSHGTVSGTVTVPTATALGTHHIELLGVTSGRNASAALQVVAGGGLANTGPPSRLLLLIGSLLLLGGIGTSLAARQWRLAVAKGRHR